MAAESASKASYHARERQSRQAFERVVGRKVSVREFRRILKERGWALPPPHGTARRRAEGKLTAKEKEREERVRRFLAEGLDRPERAEADYYVSHY